MPDTTYKAKLNKNLILAFFFPYVGYQYIKPVIDVYFSGFFANNLGRLLAVGLVVTWFSIECSRKWLQSKAYFLTFIFPIFLISIVGGTLSVEREVITLTDVFGGIYTILTTWTLYIITYSMIRRNPTLGDRVILFCAVLAIANSIVAIYGLISGESLIPDYEGIAFGFHENTGRSVGYRAENYVGFWTAPLVAYSLFYRRGLFDPIANGFLVVGIIAVVISLSRTSWISTLVIFSFWWFWTYNKRRNAYFFILLAGLAIIVIYFSVNFFQIYLGNISSHLVEDNIKRLGGVDSKLEPWMEWLSIFAANPLGVGPGGIQDIYQRGLTTLVPHSSLLDVAVEYGIFGLFVYCIPLWLLLRDAVEFVRSAKRNITLGALIGVSLGMLVSLTVLSNPFLIIFFVFLGAVQGLKETISY